MFALTCVVRSRTYTLRLPPLLIPGLKISYRVKWAQVTISDVNIIRVFSEAEMCCHSPSAAVWPPPLLPRPPPIS